MKYLMFVVHDPAANPHEPAGPTLEEWEAEMSGRGVASPEGDRLRPPEDATTVRIRGGELLVSDGPYIEAKEWVGRVRHPRLPRPRRGDRGGVEASDGAPGHARTAPVLDLYDESGRPSTAERARLNVDEALARAHRDEWARVVATLIRSPGDWSLAEDSAQDAFEKAARTLAEQRHPVQPGRLDHDRRPQCRPRPDPAHRRTSDASSRRWARWTS